MTSKTLFFNLMKEDVKRRLWTLAFSCLVFFFTFPVMIALIIGQYDNMKVESYLELVSEIQQWLGFLNPWNTFVLIVLSVIMGVTSFSYLHSRQKVDFYHGIPVGRRILFCAYYFNGIWIPFVAYGAALLMSMGVIAVNGINPALVLSGTVSSFLLFFLHYIMMYTIAVLAMVLTGNILVGILGAGVFHLYFPGLLGLIELCYNEFFHTHYTGLAFERTNIYKIIDKIPSFTLLIFNMVKFENDISIQEKLIRIFFVIGITAVLAILSYWIYRKRGSESAGKAMAFSISMPIVRIPIVVLSSLFGSVFFWYIHDSLGWALFGILCGCVLSHCVIEIIYHFDFRKLFFHWKQMIACAVMAIVIFCSFCFDLFGYDKYIPEENSIESAAVYIVGRTHWVDYGHFEKMNGGDYEWFNVDDDEYIFEHMALKNVSPVVNLVRYAVEGTQTSEGQENEQYIHFVVKYQLKNGRSRYRSYKAGMKDAFSELTKLYEDPDYLKGIYPILIQTPENTSEVKIEYGSKTHSISRDRNGTDKAMTEELLLAYQEDLENLEVETMCKENPVASIQFITKKEREVMNKNNIEKYGDICKYPVYPSFKRTLGLLKKCHADVDNWDNRKNIREIVDQSRELRFTDQEQIAQIMKNAQIAEYSNMNPFSSFYKSDRGIFKFDAYDGEQEYGISYTVAIDKLPPFLKREVEKVINQE